MTVWTKEQVENLLVVSETFDEFVHYLGMDIDPVVYRLAGHAREPLFMPCDTEYVAAWVAWTIAFNDHRSIMWMHYPYRDSQFIVEDVAAMLEKLGRLAPGFKRKNLGYLELSNGSHLIVSSVTPSSVRGRNLSDFIVQNLDPADPKHQQLYSAIAPVLYSSATCRFISILPH